MVNRRDRSALGGRGAGDGVAIAKHAGESGRGLNVVGSGRMGGALGLRAASCEPFGRGLSGAAREQPATVAVGAARTVGGVLRGPRSARAANGRGVRPLGSGTRLEPSSADRPHLGWAYVVVAVWLPTPRRARSVGRARAARTPLHITGTDALDFPGAASLRFEAVKKPLNFHLAKKEV